LLYITVAKKVSAVVSSDRNSNDKINEAPLRKPGMFLYHNVYTDMLWFVYSN